MPIKIGIFLYCMDLFVTGILLGFFLSFMIGPVFFILIETSITKGFKAALTFDAGVIIADICFILIAYFSSFQLINRIKDDPALFLFGGMIMITYGVISFIRQRIFIELYQCGRFRILVNHYYYHWSTTRNESRKND